MTKTTNFEISKKLAEIGFKKEAEYFFYKTKPDWFKETWSWQYVWHYATEGWDDANNDSNFLPSYDLETLLEFAFNDISDFKIFYNHVFIAEYWNDGCYEVIDKLLVDRELSFKSVNGKVIREYKYNYAEIVAKLIILLHEKNLIKF